MDRQSLVEHRRSSPRDHLAHMHRRSPEMSSSARATPEHANSVALHQDQQQELRRIDELPRAAADLTPDVWLPM